MNDFYNTYTINVKSGDIAKTLDALKQLSLMDHNEGAPVADLETLKPANFWGLKGMVGDDRLELPTSTV